MGMRVLPVSPHVFSVLFYSLLHSFYEVKLFGSKKEGKLFAKFPFVLDELALLAGLL